MKIPSHAARVFKGVIYDVYQWQQELFDGTTQTFEALKRPNTVIVIPLVGDQVFYAHQEQPGKSPYISLFGGRANEGETPIETAKRELLEETGFTSNDWQELRCFPAKSKIEWNVYYFVARNCQKTIERNLDAGEKIEIQQTSLDNFITSIVPLSNFGEWEMKEELLSAFNPEAAEKLKADILIG